MTRPNLPISLMHSETALQEFTFLSLNIVAGALPADLSGHMFVVAPAGTFDHALGSGPPLLNGMGKVYRFDFNAQGADPKAGAAFLSSKLTKTPCFYADQITKREAEQDEGDPLLKQVREEIYRFRDFGLARVSPRLGLYNQINTGLQPFRFATDTQDRLLVTWDVGRPYEVDPLTLDVLTPIGKLDDWIKPDDLEIWPFPFIFSTAHPVFDPVTRQDLFTVQYAGLSEIFFNLIRLHSVGVSQNRIKRYLEDIYNGGAQEVLEAGQQVITGGVRASGNALSGILKKLKQLVRRVGDVLNGPESAQEKINDIIDIFARDNQPGDFGGLRKDDATYLIRWQGSQEVKKWKLKYEDESGLGLRMLKIKQTIHQMALSKDYVVLIDTAFKLNFDGVFFKPPRLTQFVRQWFGRAQFPFTDLYIIKRADLTNDADTVIAKYLQIPRETGHYLLNYDNPNGQITLNVAHMCASDSAEWLHEFDKPVLPIDITGFNGSLAGGPTDINYAGRYVIDAENGVVLNGDGEGERACSAQTWGLALYTHQGAFSALWDQQAPRTVDDLYWIAWGCTNLQTEFVRDMYADYPYRTVPLDRVFQLAADPENNPEARPSLFRVKTKPGEPLEVSTDFYSFPPKHTVNSPQFIPRQGGDGSQTDGYVVCIVISDQPKAGLSTGDEIWVFRADQLSAGPICQLAHPEVNFGFTLHTAWLPEVKAIDRTTAQNIIPVRADFQNRVAEKPPEIKRLFEEIYKFFES